MSLIIAEKREGAYGEQQDKVLPPLLHTKWGLFPITVLVFSLVFIISSTIPMEKDLAEDIVRSLKESVSFNPLDIFIHNFTLSLVMMIPIIGFVFSIFSSSLSGMAVSAFSIMSNSNPLPLAVSLVSSPEGIFEILAYGLASAQGLAGFFAIVEKRFRKELKEYLVTIIIVIGFLLAAAFLEVSRITRFSP
ncbi:MAG: stage II sporulation protein M [Thermoproteota archaeon]